MLIDYGVFYLLLGTRAVYGADPFWFLLWLSMSYGFTNFVWIWLWLDRDGHALEWSVLILSGWLCTALLSQNFGAGFREIMISRGTSSYHGIMALFLFIGLSLIHIFFGKVQAERVEIQADVGGFLGHRRLLGRHGRSVRHLPQLLYRIRVVGVQADL